MTDEPAATAGGVRVAVGDVNGDGTADATSGQATGKRQHMPVRARSTSGQSAAPTRVAPPPSDPQTTGLLLPAVQKVREAAAAMPAWPGCHVGQKLNGVQMREAATGKVYDVLDAVVSQCAAESISLNFTKIEG
jgi:hypothetical protein